MLSIFKSRPKLSKEEIMDLQNRTSFNREELEQRYREFMKQAPSGELDRDGLRHMYKKLRGAWDPGPAVDFIFDAFDTDKNGTVSFRELIYVHNIWYNGSVEEMLKWTFKVYDLDGNGSISRAEMLYIFKTIWKVSGGSESPEERVARVFQAMDANNDGRISCDEFVEGCKRDTSLLRILNIDAQPQENVRDTNSPEQYGSSRTAWSLSTPTAGNPRARSPNNKLLEHDPVESPTLSHNLNVSNSKPSPKPRPPRPDKPTARVHKTNVTIADISTTVQQPNTPASKSLDSLSLDSEPNAVLSASSHDVSHSIPPARAVRFDEGKTSTQVDQPDTITPTARIAWDSRTRSLSDSSIDSEPHVIPIPPHLNISDSIAEVEASPFDGGGFGDVFRGTHKDGRKVAMKRLRLSYDNPAPWSKLIREAVLWREISHRYVLPFLGIYGNGVDIYSVSPYIENGDLWAHLQKGLACNRFKLLYEVAEALAHLHHRNIVHGDVKAKNILIAEDGSALLCDFGLAKGPESMVTTVASKGAGSTRWMAPEVLQEESKTSLSDVYSFGITIAEVLSGQVPFPNINLDATVIFRVVKGARPARNPSHSPTGKSYDVLWDTAGKCWAERPEERPEMAEVMGMLYRVARWNEVW